MKDKDKADAAADWVCVPREPTLEMIRAGAEAGDWRKQERVQNVYRAMIQASPARGGELDRIRSAMTDFIREHAGTKEAAATEFWLRQLQLSDAAMSREAQG